MPTKPREPITFAKLKEDLGKWFESRGHPSRPKRLTLVLGAGVSLGLVYDKKDRDRFNAASWKGLLTQLLGKTRDRLKVISKDDEIVDRWLFETSIEHRLHIIENLGQGDTDMVVAMMYLVDRLHKQLLREPDGKAKFTWQADLNNVMHYIEEGAVDTDWADALEEMGQFSRAGKLLLVTTNFDHLVARYSKLPVYVGPQTTAFINEMTYDPCPNGFVIPADKVNSPGFLGANDFNDLLYQTLPAPAAFRQVWQDPASIPLPWFSELASVLHIHGSRQVPHSLVFAPTSYDSISTSQDGSNLLGKFFQPHQHGAGAILFVGCGGTLLDPHFIEYWRNDNTDAFIACLADDKVADELHRRLSVSKCDFPPVIAHYGSDHSVLPAHLKELLPLTQ